MTPAEQGIAAAIAETERRKHIANTFPGRSFADAITFADSALVQAREVRRALDEAIGYLEQGELLAAVGTFDGLPDRTTELAVLMRLIARAAQR